MARREAAQAEARFMRGETGLDGGATEEKKDAAEVERDKARDQFLRGKTFLGREFLTWLLFRAEAGDPVVQVDGEDVVVGYTGRITLRGLHSDVVEMSARGSLAPYSDQVKHSLDRGLLVHAARLQLRRGERTWEVGLDAEFLDVRAAKLPALLSEEEDDKVAERLYLVEQLSQMVDALLGTFMQVRTMRTWSKQVVPAMKAWMKPERPAGARRN